MTPSRVLRRSVPTRLEAASWLPALFSMLVILIGCRTHENPTLIRFIESDPSHELDLQDAFRTEVVHDWELPGATRSEAPDPNLPLLDRRVELESSDVQVIEAVVENMPQGTLALRWRTAQHPFSKQRQIQLQAEHQTLAPQKVFRFDVASHPLWAGTINGLRIYTDRKIRDTVAPVRARVLTRTVDAETIDAAASQIWKVNLAREFRSALLAPPGREIARPLTVPDGAKLYLGYGLQGGVREPVEFRVLARFKDKPDRLLFEQSLVNTENSEPIWHDAVIDLADQVDLPVEIVLRTETAGPIDLARGFPLWSNPEIIGRDHRSDLPNVLLVSIDTLRADHLSLYGYERPTTPNLDRWAGRRAAVFDNAIAQAPSTLPSHASLFTGLNAFRHGVNHDPGPASLETLAEILRRAGYRTVAQTGGGYMHPAYGFLQGFDVYRYWLWGYDRLEEFPAGMAATRSWIETHRERPFFLFFHTYEAHGPYRARQPFFDQFTDNSEAPEDLLWMTNHPVGVDQGFQPRRTTDYRYGSSDPSATTARKGSSTDAINLYDSSVAYVDAELAGLWELLEELELEEQTMVVVTSDHGEAFGEHGLAGHGYLYDHNLRVPLAISFPEARFAGRRVERQVRSIDILPTILEAVGLPPPADIDGRSLSPLLERPSEPFPLESWSYAANDNFGVSLRVDNRRKLIYNDAVWPPIHAQEEFYLLDSDPDESEPSLTSAREAERMRELLQSTLARESRGLIIRLANQESESFAGELGGDWVGQTRIKAPRLPCSCLRWSDDDTVGFEVPPGSRYELILDANPASSGWIRLGLEGESPDPTWELEYSLRLEDLDQPLAFERVNGTWEVLASTPTEIGTGARIHWQGRSPGDGVDLSKAEADLRRQMKALGYLQ